MTSLSKQKVKDSFKEFLDKAIYLPPFLLNQKVFIITRMPEKRFINCELCNGDKNLILALKNKTISCPECYGKGGETKYFSEKWILVTNEPYIIKKISLEHYCNKEEEWQAMCEETGVGSGTWYNMKNMFSSRSEAINECNIRNENYVST
jgi:hypothetical protein